MFLSEMGNVQIITCRVYELYGMQYLWAASMILVAACLCIVRAFLT